jgi:hypothetical protein
MTNPDFKPATIANKTYVMKNFVLLCTIAILGSISLVISSCKDDEPPAKPVISFGTESKLVPESSAPLEIEVTLDKPAPKDLTIEYTVEGTALNNEVAGANDTWDYSISGGSGELDIAAGKSTGIIEITLNPDQVFEGDETIVITLDDAGTDAQITDGDAREITITVSDDDPKPNVSFKTASLTMNEDDSENIIEIEVQLDHPAASNLTIGYEISGSAIDSVFGSTEGYPAIYWDYYIDGTAGQVTIQKGQTIGKIDIQVLMDFGLELENEEIVLTLTDAGSSAVIGSDDEVTITIEPQDGKAIILGWEPTYPDVDMDLFLWDGLPSNNRIFLASNLADTTLKGELLFLPSVLTTGTLTLGMSYVYYSGSADPMHFKVRFADVTGGVLEPLANQDVFEATYTAANKNAYDQTHVDPIIEQTVDIAAGVYQNFSAITVPSANSRIPQNGILQSLKYSRHKSSKSLTALSRLK